jgi:NAD(P)-dependent dehydrogenase (short-subunit alcohol dehydrogenase family)
MYTIQRRGRFVPFIEQYKQEPTIMSTTYNNTALITGASRGLGRAFAEQLAADGWNLIIDARGNDALMKVAHNLSSITEVRAIAGDVNDQEHRSALAAAAGEWGIDLLVNNAGILGPSPQPSLMEYPLDHLLEVFRTNVVAQLGVIQSLRDHLRPGGRIINVTSDASVEPYAGWGGYGASKAALDQLSAILAAENPDLRIYGFDPGDMRTAMHQEAFPGEDISDRPLPQESVPAMMILAQGHLPSGRYRAHALREEVTQ